MLIVVIALVVGWIVAVLACVLAYRLTVARGRLLLRIERLEQRFAEVSAAPDPESLRELGLPVGAPAPDFELPDLDGIQHALSSWRGTSVLLIFFDPQCRFCVEMAPELVGAVRARRSGEMVPLIVTTGDVDANRRLLSDAGIDCPVLRQDVAEVASLFQAQATPSAHLLDERGIITTPLVLGAEEVLALLREPTTSGAEAADRSRSPQVPPVSHRPRSIAESKLTRSGLTAGMPAPAFTLPDVKGGVLSLAEYTGRRVLLVFSDPTCAPCQILAPELERLHQRSPEVRIIMISRGTREDNLAKAEEHGLTFPIALQRHWEISRAYGMFATPIAYLIDEHSTLESEAAVGNDAILELATGQRARGMRGKEAARQ